MKKILVVIGYMASIMGLRRLGALITTKTGRVYYGRALGDYIERPF